MKKPELLAPAGSMDSATAALRCGADAVYIGGKNFSARQNASNFDPEQMTEAARLCHLYGKKLYLTVNTIIFDDQVKEFAKAIENALAAGIDAFIVQDWGAAEIIKSVSPESRIHASTQMTIHSPAGAVTAKKLGFARAVLSRELSAVQIKEISMTGIETEIFVHGALCMSVSGQCYLSAMIGQRSANRGLCAQPCRLPFSSCKNGGYCGLSLKDLSLAGHIDEITGTEITSLKIEGRMKRPEYVAASVSAFRNIIDGKPADLDMLKAVFSRSGFTDGYFTGQLKNMFGTREKEDVVSAKDVFPEIHKLYRTERKVAGLNFSAEIMHDSPIKLTAADNDNNSAEVYGNLPQKAVNKSVDKEFLEKQLSKLGNTVYEYGNTNCKIGEGLAVSAGELNGLRRKAVEAVDLKRIKSNTPIYKISGKLPQIADTIRSLNEIRARISNLNQFKAAESADRIIMPIEIIAPGLFANREKIIAEPPRFIVDETKTKKALETVKNMGITHLICNNIAYLQMGKELGFTLHGDFGLNVSNSYSANMLSSLGLDDITLSFEIKSSQISKLKSPIPAGIIGYGRLPLMLVRNCPIKNESGCKGCKKNISDRTGKTFPVVCRKEYAEILNSQKLYIADKLNEFRNISFMTLYFTDETPAEITEIINGCRVGGCKKENITRGLYFRGVI